MENTEAQKLDPKTTDANALFTQYMNVVNRALGKHRHEVPFKHLISAGERLLADKNIGVQIYKDNPETPHDYFTVKLHDGSFDIVEHAKAEPDVEWRVDQEHLENVVRDPDPFIEHPTRLDLDWLKTRVGIS